MASHEASRNDNLVESGIDTTELLDSDHQTKASGTESPELIEMSKMDDATSDDGPIINATLLRNGTPSHDTVYRRYPIRWLMLLALIVLNMSNGMVCIIMYYFNNSPPSQTPPTNTLPPWQGLGLRLAS